MALLFFMVIVLIIYGSLYPFDFTFAAPDPQALEDFVHLQSPIWGRGDAFGNVALFAPYGFLGMLALPTSPTARSCGSPGTSPSSPTIHS